MSQPINIHRLLSPSPRACRSCSRSNHLNWHTSPELQYRGSLKISPFDLKEMRTDAYIANFELMISTYFRGGDAPDHGKRQMFSDALSNQRKSAMGCQKLEGTFETLIKSFKRFFDLSLWEALSCNIMMKEGQSIAAFSNHLLDLLRAECDSNNKITVMSLSADFWLRCRGRTQYWCTTRARTWMT